MKLTVYTFCDGPPSLAVLMTLKYLGLEHEVIELDYSTGEHMSEEFAKLNPQKELPVLIDNGFVLGESNAILQYLADKYPKNDTLYPKDPQTRALVNHRLCFNLSTYYRHIYEYTIGPIFFDYHRTAGLTRKLHIGLSNFNTYLERLNKRYVASDDLTIADFPLVTATACLEATNTDISKYPKICEWYARFKKEFPEIWKVGDIGMKELINFKNNPPDLSHLDHPIHPIRKENRMHAF